MSKRQRKDSSFNIDEVVKECVRYIYSHGRDKTPIKRAELVKHLITSTQMPNNQFKNVIIAAKADLKRIYQWKLVQADTKSCVQYIVVYNKEQEQCLVPVHKNADNKTVLVATLLHIFMSGAPVREEHMYQFLEQAGLLTTGPPTLKELLTSTFTKELYLTYTKVIEGESHSFVFDWGIRAKEEVPKMFLLKKFANAMGRDVDYWCEQHKNAMKDIVVTEH